MFENEAKGWYGSYSVAGRNSAEKYAAIVHKDEIFKNERKKIKIKDIFTPDEEEPRFPIENNLDIFKVYSSSKSQQQSKSHKPRCKSQGQGPKSVPLLYSDVSLSSSSNEA